MVLMILVLALIFPFLFLFTYNEKHNPTGSNVVGLKNKQRLCPVGVDVIVVCSLFKLLLSSVSVL